jgi:N-hydroxyarylamine O-acetyltransferase
VTDLERYLDRIGVERPAEPDAVALARLHEAHLVAIPFENLSIVWGEPMALDEGLLHRKVVDRRRGGGCHELNALFAWGLRAIGYDVDLLSARVRRDDGGFGPAYDHMCLRVRASGRDWLADVGFGDSFRRPILLEAGTVHDEGCASYTLLRAGQELDLARHDEGGAWSTQYRIDPVPRQLEDFVPMSRYHQTSPDAPFTRRRICTAARPWGRVTLTDRALVRTTLRGERTEEAVPDEASWAAALRTHFGIERTATGDGR